MKAAKESGPEGAVKAAQAFVDDPAHRYADVEQSLIVAEQQALSGKEGPAALEVARWSAARFPRNSDLATVLALVANAQGQGDEARRALDAALAIDPNNRSAQSLAEALKTK